MHAPSVGSVNIPTGVTSSVGTTTIPSNLAIAVSPSYKVSSGLRLEGMDPLSVTSKVQSSPVLS